MNPLKSIIPMMRFKESNREVLTWHDQLRLD